MTAFSRTNGRGVVHGGPAGVDDGGPGRVDGVPGRGDGVPGRGDGGPGGVGGGLNGVDGGPGRVDGGRGAVEGRFGGVEGRLGDVGGLGDVGDLVGVIDLSGPVLQVGVLPFGARLAVLRAPDWRGSFADVVLGLDTAGYAGDRTYQGATVGRYANRIAGGTFVLDGERYTVPCNEDGAALHGGPDGFDRQWFTPDPVVTGSDGAHSVTLRRTSPDGENGFPGNLAVAVTYAVHGAELHIEHTATTDAPTVVNMTNHAYLNLTGHGGPVADHVVRIPARHYLPVDEHLVPSGGPAPVADTPFDLRRPTRIGEHLRAAHPQLVRTRGYDHTFVLDAPPGRDLALAAVVEEPESGRTLTVLTDQPGVQFYSGNFLDGTLALRDGTVARQSDAFCLEPQHFPNSPNEPTFPSTVLRPGETYRSRIVLRFGVRA